MATTEPHCDIDNLDRNEVGERVGPHAQLESQLRHRVALEKSQRDLDERLKTVKAEIAEMNDNLVEQMAMAGMQNAKVDGMTVFLRTDKFVSKKGGTTTVQMCQILRYCGLDYMVAEGYSASSLKSKIKEYGELGEQVPSVLLDALNITEETKVVARK